MNVSVEVVNNVQLTYHVNKSLMVSAILIFFTFVAVAISLAYEPAPEGPLYTTVSPDHGSGDGLLGSDTFAQRYAVICVSGDVPRSTQPNFQSYRINYVRVVDPVKLAFSLENHVPRVSLQILQSVLLI
jgi:multisubunit Na+/H+ antiporter MnhC subunit